MARIPLDLIPQDYRRGKRGNPYACLLEKAAERQHGVKLKVGGSRARERGAFFPRTWSLDNDAQQVVGLFDSRAPQRDIFHGRSTVRVHLHGKPFPQQQHQRRGRSRPQPEPERRRGSRHKAATASVAVIGSMALIGDGLAWVVVTAAGLMIAIVAAVAGTRARRAFSGRDAGTPVRAAVPAAASTESSREPEPDWTWAAPRRPAEPERATEPETADWHPRWPEGVAAPGQMPAGPDEPASPSWPEDSAADATVPDEAAWPHVPGYDPGWRAEEAIGEPVRSR